MFTWHLRVLIGKCAFDEAHVIRNTRASISITVRLFIIFVGFPCFFLLQNIMTLGGFCVIRPFHADKICRITNLYHKLKLQTRKSHPMNFCNR